MPLILHRLDKSSYGDFIECPTEEMVIVYSGAFSMNYIYYICHEWFVENGYCPADEQSFDENLYSQRDSQAGREIFIRWRLRKDTGDPFYYQYELDLIWHALGLADTELTIDGKKVKLDKGEIEFKMFGRIRKSKQYANSWFMKNWFISKWFKSNYLTDKEVQHFIAFESDLTRFKEMLKEYFDIERYSKTKDLLEFYKGRMG